MKRRTVSKSQPLRRRLGTLLLLLGGALLAVPVGIFVYDEIAYRYQVAQVPTPSPVMLPPLADPSPSTAQGEGPDEREGLAENIPGGGATNASGTEPHRSTPSVTAVGSGSPAGEGAGGTEHDSTPGSAQDASTYQISIPRIGVTYLVGEGIDNPVLDQGPGHYPQTALPGEHGNAALAGHRTIRGRPAYFYDLDKLEAGDEIQVAYHDRTLTFEVEQVFLTSPYDLSVLAPTEHAALTLTTCDPPGSDEMRLIVQSRLVKEEKT